MTQIISTDKGWIEYSLQGTGIPILFVHGGHSSCHEKMFHKGFDTTKFCLITPSRPGYGNTPLNNHTTPRQTADLFVALLDELKLESVIVMGISAGGLSAVELASNYPDRVSKLILASAVTQKWMHKADKTYKKAKKIFSPAVEKYSWAFFRFLYGLFPILMAKIMFKELSNYRPCDLTKNHADELYGMIRYQRSKEGFVNDLDQDIHQESLRRITCLTLILHSTNDNSVRVEHAIHAHAMIKNSILKLYNNQWGHLLWLGEERQAPVYDTLTFMANS